jgi:hypothetical protein
MTNQKEWFITEHNVTTGEITSRPATEEEKLQHLAAENEFLQNQLNRAKEQEELEKQKEELLTKLGLTKEQFDLLIK